MKLSNVPNRFYAAIVPLLYNNMRVLILVVEDNRVRVTELVRCGT